jgi:asparagine synthase (glutamine-hydrolysing)
MCGITLYLIHNSDKNKLKSSEITFNSSFYKEEILKSSKSIRHRGPDWSGNEIISKSDKTIYFAHERLSIIDPLKGSQPIIYEEYSDENKTIPTRKIVLCVNGEIYNYKELRLECDNYYYKTDSDCEVIIALYLKFVVPNIIINKKINMVDINKLLSKLDGQFSFTLYDNLYDVLLIARDPIGITSLYYGFDENNNLMVSSEMKGLHLCNYVAPFPNGNYLCLVPENLKTNFILPYSSLLDFSVKGDKNNIKFIKYYSLTELGKWNNTSMENNLISKTITQSISEYEETIYSKIRTIFTNSVKKRLMSDVPFGVLLSGGLDSSLVTSITTKLVKDGEIDLKWGSHIHSFAIGLDNGSSSDLDKAAETANFLNTIHHNFTFTIQEGIDALRDVIWHLETYDITTIRASTPMYLLSRKIKAMGVKMVLSGEGADELLGGYLYFLSAPDNKSFYEETKRRVQELGYFDCLRANKSTLGWGLEGRFPFLDKEFVDLCFKIHPKLKKKNNIEKYVMRKAFDIKDEKGNPVYLPDSILWRQKEQFSDGVGYGWIDATRDLGESTVSDSDFVKRKEVYPLNTPETKEAFMFRRVFTDLFPNRASTVKKWIPRTDWEGVGSDPSGRAQKVHEKSY